MTLKLFDTFTNRTTANVGAMYNSAVAVSITANGVDGKASCEGTAINGALSYSNTFGSTVFIGMKYKINALGSGTILRYYITGSNMASVLITAGGFITLCKGSGTVLATSSSALSINTWYWIEIKYLADGTNGEFVLKVNGEELANFAGDTTDLGNIVDQVQVFLANNAQDAILDTIYFADGNGGQTFLDDLKGKTLFPSGAGNYTDWTPLSGSNYQMVDDNPSSAPCPDGDTTYNASATATNKDSFAYDNTGLSTAIIHGVQVEMYVRKDDEAVKQIRPFVRLSGVDYFGDTVNLSDSYLYYTYIWTLNPATAAAWSISEIDAAEFGYELVS